MPQTSTHLAETGILLSQLSNPSRDQDPQGSNFRTLLSVKRNPCLDLDPQGSDFGTEKVIAVVTCTRS